IGQAQLYQKVQNLNASLECQVEERTAQLQQKMQELQALYQTKDVFLHAFSHDLRTPIMGTSLVLKNLLNQAEEEVTLSRSLLERMVQSSDRQLNLINSLLEAHSSEVQGLILHREPVQLSQMIQRLVEDLEPLATKHQATLTNLVSEELPVINVDPTQLSRVFENLLTNALKHNQPGLSLTLNATLEEDSIRCTVADDGQGMSQQQCDRLFDLYYRGGNSRHFSGIGLGLYLCRQIIMAHGGEIGVISSVGAGTTFWFTFPLTIDTPLENCCVQQDF
ncbi:MAG TPA: histidine kinase, partial [Cyanobacteria bacterium UBA8543]|nr:histidine kinase [Cyanobacteria bacterium UBA8543]